MAHIKKLVMYGFKSFPRKTEIPFDTGINVILGPNGSGKSCSYDTIVTLADGSEIELGKLIEDKINSSKESIKYLDDGVYVDAKDTDDLDSTTEIISLNKTTMKSEIVKVSKFIKRDGDNLYHIKTRSGRELKATKCHPIMSFSNGEVRSKTISELDKGSFIAVPRIMLIESNKEDTELSRLMGYIIGDGYIAKDRIEFVNKDKEILEDYESLLLKFTQSIIKKRMDKNVVRIYSRDKLFYNRIRELYKTNKKTITSKDKNIPNYFLKLNNKSISNLLAGLFDTDGSFGKDYGLIEYCTKNKDLARQIQYLLLRFNINSKIKKRICYASNTKEKKKNEYYYLYIYGIENLKKFYENIPIRVNSKKGNLERAASSNILSNNNVDLLPREINEKIKELTLLLGIKIKPIRKEYPSLTAYIDNRCSPSRQGLNTLLPLFNQKFAILFENFKNLNLNQYSLIKFMDLMNLSSHETAISIGLNKTIITDRWEKGLFNPRQINLIKLKEYLSNVFLARIAKISKTLNLLQVISNSDILWDEVTSIVKLDKPQYVYDLTIDKHHNFVANNIFVHNSNISDALCFVLGRLSIKSIRAKKASNLMFMGTKAAAPSKEAMVELVFSNDDKAFTLDSNEVSIKRIVRKNGLSIYKINNETKTRTDVLSLLAQAGIDPNGFNIILQGEIQNFVRMKPEDRRGIIEEVSGISIYESRKQKSLKELEKTEEKLKEVSAILRERTSYLNNLEKERQEALRFKKLEKDVKVFKASIINQDLVKKKKEVELLQEEISKKLNQIEKSRNILLKIQAEIDNSKLQIASINSKIEKSSGVEQELLNREIADIRAELAGLSVKIENFESKISQTEKQKQELNEKIVEHEQTLRDLRKEAPLAKKETDLERKKKEFEQIEEQRKKFYMIKSELKSIKERIKDKEQSFQNLKNESELNIRQIDSIISELFDKNSTKEKLNNLKKTLSEKNQISESLNVKERELEKQNYNSEREILNLKKIIQDISKLDICPLCKSKITPDHISSIKNETSPRIKEFERQVSNKDKELNELYTKRDLIKEDIKEISSEITKRESDLNKLIIINEKKERIKSLQELIDKIKEELSMLKKRNDSMEKTFDDFSNIEQKYETVRLELQEISMRSEETVSSEISFKQRELERMKSALKQLSSDEIDIKENLKSLIKDEDEKESILEDKNKREEELVKKNKELINNRDKIQESIRDNETQIIHGQNEIHNIEQKINDLKVDKARYNAELENLEVEMLSFPNIPLIKGSKDFLNERLQKTQEVLSRIGTVNLRSLEVYDEIKKEYDTVREKAELITKEKEGIMKIIHEIDIKKKKAFSQTLDTLNEIFSRNFSQLSTKGHVSLEVENKKDPFEGGVGILVKTGHGKYFDVTSLSGGEQTLVALSLIFAIQEYRPYHFYILDEIDAALDKRNSERLAGLLKKYMQKGQYIVITHNDEVITNATNLYGVSMHEGISKIISMKL